MSQWVRIPAFVGLGMLSGACVGVIVGMAPEIHHAVNGSTDGLSDMPALSALIAALAGAIGGAAIAGLAGASVLRHAPLIPAVLIPSAFATGFGLIGSVQPLDLMSRAIDGCALGTVITWWIWRRAPRRDDASA